MGFFFVSIPKCASNSISDFTNFNKMYYHCYANVVKHKFLKNWDSMYTFACVRHPIDMVISWYNYHKYAEREAKWVNDFYPEDINTWVENGCKTHWQILSHKKLNPHWIIKENPLIQYKYICDENENIIVKKIIKLENLKEDIEDVRKALKIDTKKEIKIENDSKKISNRDSLSKKSIQLIKEMFKKDFEILGYK